MNNETIILLVLLILVVAAISGFVVYSVVKHRDKKSETNKFMDKLDEQTRILENSRNNQQQEPVYVPVIYGANRGWGDWHRPYWGMHRRRRDRL